MTTTDDGPRPTTSRPGHGPTGDPGEPRLPRPRRPRVTEDQPAGLDPDQARLVHRRFDGPACVSGPTGTGKTRVALHRAARAARQPGAKVLLTSSAATLPQVLGEQLRRLAPEHADRVQHVGVDAWARALLRERGVRLGRVEREAVDVAFGRAWSLQGRDGPLSGTAAAPTYWQEEIRHVIKGRGLTRFEDYAALERVGRRTPVAPRQREAVWRLHRSYEALLRDRGLNDPADVVLLALAELAARPVEQPYTAVVVDEAQDLPLVAVQLLHRLVGDRPDGLLLVGDPAQALHPLTYRLAETGVTVTGRTATLRVEHRGGAEVVEVQAPSTAELDRALVDALLAAVRGGVRPADCAVLVRGAADVARWVALLLASGLPVLGLTAYRGQATDAVKVGTLHRARGLEFRHVVVVDADRGPARRAGEDDDAAHERAELRRRRVHVALTRAQETAWCGRVVPPGRPR